MIVIDAVMPSLQDDCYSLVFGNNHWYIFLRLHQMLCDRLYIFYNSARLAIEEEAKAKVKSSEVVETALALRLKSPRKSLIASWFHLHTVSKSINRSIWDHRPSSMYSWMSETRNTICHSKCWELFDIFALMRCRWASSLLRVIPRDGEELPRWQSGDPCVRGAAEGDV